jgi:hypothetical protein
VTLASDGFVSSSFCLTFAPPLPPSVQDSSFFASDLFPPALASLAHMSCGTKWKTLEPTSGR